MSFKSEIHSFSLTHPFPGQKISSRRPEDLLSTFGHHGVHLTEILLISLFAAVPAGFAGAFFRMSVSWANAVRTEHPALLFGLPAAGLLIAYLYRACRISHRGELMLLTDVVHGKFSDGNHSQNSPQLERSTLNAVSKTAVFKEVSPFLAPLIYIASVLSHLCGASVGCEGASILLGGGLGAQFGRWFHLSGKDLSLIILSAMAGAFAPLLGTPLAAAVFVLERCRFRGLMGFLSCLCASFFSYEITHWLGLPPCRFSLDHAVPAFSGPTVGRVFLLTLLCILAGSAFCGLLKCVERLADRFCPNRFLAMGLGGLLVALLTFGCGTQTFCGAGFANIQNALHGEAENWDFCLKIGFTALALGVGFKGGQIVPAFFSGAALGCVLAPWLDLEPAFAAAVGLIVLFAVVVRCPIASVFLALELFFGMGFGWFCFAAILVFCSIEAETWAAARLHRVSQTQISNHVASDFQNRFFQEKRS